MAKALSDDQIQQYREKGYLCPVRVIPPEEAIACRQRLEAIEELMGGKFNGIQRTKFYLRYRWAYELATTQAMLDAVEDLIGPNILLYHNTSWLKRAGDQAYVSWHQDNNYIGVEPCEMLSFWIALTPSTLENGCMQVLPGTHRGGQLPTQTPDLNNKNMLPSGLVAEHDLSKTKPVAMELAPGEASIHHAYTVHGSEANLSDQRRMGITFLFFPTHLEQKGARRTSAMLVRGEDRYGHFDAEIPPASDDDPDAIARHERSATQHRGKEEELGKKTVARFD